MDKEKLIEEYLKMYEKWKNTENEFLNVNTSIERKIELLEESKNIALYQSKILREFYGEESGKDLSDLTIKFCREANAVLRILRRKIYPEAHDSIILVEEDENGTIHFTGIDQDLYSDDELFKIFTTE